MRIKTELKFLDHAIRDNHGTVVPKYSTVGSAAVDLYAAINDVLVLKPGDEAMIPTGMAIAPDTDGVVSIIAPRSGLGSRGFMLRNTIGVIDSDYRGELMLMAKNSGHDVITIERGMRVAQLMLLPIQRFDFTVVDQFSSETDRGAGGFGSTGH